MSINPLTGGPMWGLCRSAIWVLYRDCVLWMTSRASSYKTVLCFTRVWPSIKRPLRSTTLVEVMANKGDGQSLSMPGEIADNLNLQKSYNPMVAPPTSLILHWFSFLLFCGCYDELRVHVIKSLVQNLWANDCYDTVTLTVAHSVDTVLVTKGADNQQILANKHQTTINRGLIQILHF